MYTHEHYSQIYWYTCISQILGERLQDYWSSGSEEVKQSIMFSYEVLALHYENLPMKYTEIFKVVKNENFHWKFIYFFFFFLIFAQNIDCGYALEPSRRGKNLARQFTSTHNLCFGAKIRKIGIPLQTPVSLYK